MDTEQFMLGYERRHRRTLNGWRGLLLLPVVLAMLGAAWFSWRVYPGEVFGALAAGLAGGLVAFVAVAALGMILGLCMELMEMIAAIFRP